MTNSIQATAPGDPGGSAEAAGVFPEPGYGGLSWTWELDLDAVLAAVRGAAPWQRRPARPGFAATAPAAAAADAGAAAAYAARAPATSAAADGSAA
ncbi:MAG TPA: hypothetical protein VHJ18_12450, partial [Streptosporangiaceae bacterium]|nr:hypothetical protein [Streptosporangiaceae bacterium]